MSAELGAVLAREGVRTPETARSRAVPFGAARLVFGIYHEGAINPSSMKTPDIKNLPHDAIATVSHDERKNGVRDDVFAKGLIQFKNQLKDREGALRSAHAGTREENSQLDKIIETTMLMHHLGVTGITPEEVTTNIQTNIRERYLGKQTDIKKLVEDVVAKYKDYSGPSWQEALSKTLDSDYTFLFFYAFGGRDTATLILHDIRARMLLDKDTPDQDRAENLGRVIDDQTFFLPLHGNDQIAFAHLARVTAQSEIKVATPIQPSEQGATQSPAQPKQEEQPAAPAQTPKEQPIQTAEPEQEEIGSPLEAAAGLTVNEINEAVVVGPAKEEAHFETQPEVTPLPQPQEQTRLTPPLLSTATEEEKTDASLKIAVPPPLEIPRQEIKSVETSLSHVLAVGMAEMQGARRSMEDAHVIERALGGNPKRDFYAIYDGHGGKEVADKAAGRLHLNLALALDVGHLAPSEAFTVAYQQTDESMQKENAQGGATALTVLVEGDKMFVANLGDTRAVLIHGNGQEERLSHDRKASDPEEEERVIQRGGQILNGRVLGLLAPSAALGDFDYPGLQKDPDLREVTLKPDDKWLVMACDGVWDVIKDSEVMTIIGNETDPDKISNLLIQEAYNRGSGDNLSAIVLQLS